MHANTHLPIEACLEAALRAELSAGERLLWSARPNPMRMRFVFWAWLFAIPWTLFSLVWTGFAAMIFASGATSDAADFSWWFIVMPLFGLPFVAIGGWMMWEPVRLLLEAQSQIHALSTQRIMTLTLRGGKRLNSVDILKLGPIKRSEKRDGSGNLTIETGSHRDSDGDRITDKFEIYAVPGVAKLHHLLRAAQAAARAV